MKTHIMSSTFSDYSAGLGVGLLKTRPSAVRKKKFKVYFCFCGSCLTVLWGHRCTIVFCVEAILVIVSGNVQCYSSV